MGGTVDGSEILANQLIWFKYPIIYRVSYMLGGAGFLPSTVGSKKKNNWQYRSMVYNMV